MVHNVWVRELRAPFLLLPLIFVPVGLAISWAHGSFNLLYAILTLAGALFLHAGVNVLNDYFDYKSGIDIITTPTPFSGGSRILPGKELTPNNVLGAGLLFLLGGVLIGGFFVVELSYSPLLILILAVAAISVLGYSPVFAKIAIGELLAGLNFGPLLVLGTFYVQTRTIALEPIFVGACLGILTSCILYINEFPDTAADSQKGRFHLVARWGKAVAAKRFGFLIGSAYAVLVLGVLLRIVTPFALISLLTVPKAIRANRILSAKFDSPMELIPGMAETVMTTLWTGVLILAGYIISIELSTFVSI
ncbi:MAG: prenyltransferase [Thaumarchaeota archaeon]|nr:prenyltransferase [Nitrososphaerota archaeon]